MDESKQPQERQGPGKVSRGVNMGLDAAYVAIWGIVTIIGVVGIFTPARLWGAAVAVVAGYFAYRNISNIVVHRGRE
jgi:hypothetical protein